MIDGNAKETPPNTNQIEDICNFLILKIRKKIAQILTSIA